MRAGDKVIVIDPFHGYEIVSGGTLISPELYDRYYLRVAVRTDDM